MVRKKQRGLGLFDTAGRLFRTGKVELRTSELLDAEKALAHLKNARQHGCVRVRLQEQFDATKVNALKTFHQEFFDRSNSGKEARSVGEAAANMFGEESREMSCFWSTYTNRQH